MCFYRVPYPFSAMERKQLEWIRWPHSDTWMPSRLECKSSKHTGQPLLDALGIHYVWTTKQSNKHVTCLHHSSTRQESLHTGSIGNTYTVYKWDSKTETASSLHVLVTCVNTHLAHSFSMLQILWSTEHLLQLRAHKPQCYMAIWLYGGSLCGNLPVACSSSSHRCHSGRSSLLLQRGISHIWRSGTASLRHHHQTNGTPNTNTYQILLCTSCIHQPATYKIQAMYVQCGGASRHAHPSTATHADTW